ncbi:MAG: PEP-utilizing enzyme [Roseibacillus sp.]|nr:PEP-utilizing enzyme [Roseibacillus sp.]
MAPFDLEKVQVVRELDAMILPANFGGLGIDAIAMALSPAAVEDVAAFPEGAILVARTTSPAWTPLFYSAVGVVTESGGPLSHGAVVARELRLPAVMAVRAALRELSNGVRVRIDGTCGLVTIVEEQP